MLFATALVLLGVAVLRVRSLSPRLLTFLTGGGIAFFVVGALRVLRARKLWAQPRRLVQIDTDGVTCEGQFHSWNGIGVFYANLAVDGAHMRFTLAKPMSRVYPIDVTPVLTVDEYRALAQKVLQQIGTAFPHVKVDPEPRRQD